MGPLYLSAMNAIYAQNPGQLFMIEGVGQLGFAVNWGDGFVTDLPTIRACAYWLQSLLAVLLADVHDKLAGPQQQQRLAGFELHGMCVLHVCLFLQLGSYIRLLRRDGLSDPNLFFTQLATEPYLNNVSPLPACAWQQFALTSWLCVPPVHSLLVYASSRPSLQVFALTSSCLQVIIGPHIYPPSVTTATTVSLSQHHCLALALLPWPLQDVVHSCAAPSHDALLAADLACTAQDFEGAALYNRMYLSFGYLNTVGYMGHRCAALLLCSIKNGTDKRRSRHSLLQVLS